ncbi:hypothetical protein [Chishuiella sp.]|uniref:hypothetical protein n=1 Tax=Chishuiella sp. TaxID=1969467 RepID=UPI0028A70A29|nr:hypothetical protein [Chishuiella sp.]
MDKKAIFDFDKTLISINTFTYWVFHLWLISLKKGNFKLFFKITFLIFSRKVLKNISHKNFKEKLLLFDYNQEYDILFCKKISKYINYDILNSLNKLNEQNYFIAISSAAPEKYLKIFVNNYLHINKSLVLGSVLVDGKIFENFQKNKLLRLIETKFIEKDEVYECLFTDSDDDIFLGENAKKISLVNPTKEILKNYMNVYSSKIEIKKAGS